jgi:N-carbamoyl-L-amino-acid hydrolase
MRINRQRLATTFEAFSQVGATPNGGLTRVALTDEDKQARDQMVLWMQEAGLRVTVDQGNIFGERPRD